MHEYHCPSQAVIRWVIHGSLDVTFFLLFSGRKNYFVLSCNGVCMQSEADNKVRGHKMHTTVGENTAPMNIIVSRWKTLDLVYNTINGKDHEDQGYYPR